MQYYVSALKRAARGLRLAANVSPNAPIARWKVIGPWRHPIEPDRARVSHECHGRPSTDLHEPASNRAVSVNRRVTGSSPVGSRKRSLEAPESITSARVSHTLRLNVSGRWGASRQQRGKKRGAGQRPGWSAMSACNTVADPPRGGVDGGKGLARPSVVKMFLARRVIALGVGIAELGGGVAQRLLPTGCWDIDAAGEFGGGREGVAGRRPQGDAVLAGH